MTNTFAIIVIYNGMRNNWIQKCFDSVLNSSIPVKIIAIDNGSTDGSIAFIQENYSQIEFVISKENLGFGKANNIGLRKALDHGGDYFFLLNQDAWVEVDAIEKLIKKAKENPEYGIISPMHFNGAGNALDYNFSNSIMPKKCNNLYSDITLGKKEDKIYDCLFVCAAAWLLTKECLRLVGGFSPTFFHYGEDDNYVQRLHYKGLKFGVDPNSIIFHDRQDRKAQTLNDGLNEKLKNLIVSFSHPNGKKPVVQRMYELKKDIVEFFIFRKSIRNEIYFFKFLNKNKKKIIENLEMSRSNKEYSFLED